MLLARRLLPVALAVAVVLAVAPAAGYADVDNVKYYVVASDAQGRPETLEAIAGKLLGDPNRAAEIYNLNAGRQQADGGALGVGGALHVGWVLVLPWDAVGPGAVYGVLPGAAGASALPGGSAAPGTSTAPGGTPAVAPRCTVSRAGSGAPQPWAQLRLRADRAWPYAKGAGVLVAVVDTGVDAGQPALRGHVATGADTTAGSAGGAPGNVDCDGSGTAMAGLIVGQSTDLAPAAGVAPEATVLPLRVVGGDGRSVPADQAAAVRLAVAGGARVIALGSAVGLGAAEVAAAIGDAVARDVVVVVPATAARPGAAGAGAGAVAQLLRVGGIGEDGRMAGVYPPGGVDVLAPAVHVLSVGVDGAAAFSGTGIQYAVALAAGVVALVRSRYPQLPAAQVVHRVKLTAQPASTTLPDPTTGWGVLDPLAAVTRAVPGEPPETVPGTRQGLSTTWLALLAVFGVFAVAVVSLFLPSLRLAARRGRRPATVDGAPSGGGVPSGGDGPAGGGARVGAGVQRS